VPPTFTASFSGPDILALTRTLIRAASYARGMPTEMRHKVGQITPTPDWRERMLARDINGLSVSWGANRVITRDGCSVTADFPSVPIDPVRVLEHVEGLPFEMAVMPAIREWMDEYFAPSGGGDHAFMGWGMIFKGAGHDNAIVSRRWLEHAPARLVRGGNDTTLVQFHELEPEPADPLAIDHTTLEQARQAHAWMLAGLLRPRHRYAGAVQGAYSSEDGLIRVFAIDRDVTDRELLDACAARRDRKHDMSGPVRNVAFVFTQPAAARAHLDALWLRGLECRLLVDGVEIRLDENHSVPVRAPAWTTPAARDQREAEERERRARIATASAAAAAVLGNETSEALVVSLEAAHAAGTTTGSLPAGLGAEGLPTT
jgi:hypothetical protein